MSVLSRGRKKSHMWSNDIHQLEMHTISESKGHSKGGSAINNASDSHACATERSTLRFRETIEQVDFLCVVSEVGDGLYARMCVCVCECVCNGMSVP